MSDIGIKEGNMDMLIFGIIVLLFGLLILIVDFIIFAYWISYLWKVYSFEKTYGPTLKFPPRAEGDESLEQAYLEKATVERSAIDYASVIPAIPEAGEEAVTEEEYPPLDPNLLSAQGGIRSPFARSWSLVHSFVGFQVVMLVANLLAVLALLPTMIGNPLGMQSVTNSAYGILVTVVALVVQNAGFVGMTAYFLKGYGTSLQSIGLRTPTFREIGLGLGLGLALVLISGGVEVGFDRVLSHLLPHDLMVRLMKLTESITAGGVFEGIHGVWLKVLFVLAGTIAAPIGEEVFFRGLLYNGLKRRWGILTATLLSALAFGIIHMGPLAILVIIPMGIVLAMVYERTRSLWVTILMHAVNNGVTFAIAMTQTAKPGH